MQDRDLRIRVNVPRSRVPAITDVDCSARIQTVDADRHGRFYRLMQRFQQLTGCPVIVNTSFNIRGEPIVCNPEEAFNCFLGTEMDVLVLENCLLLKEHQHPASLQDAESYKAQYAWIDYKIYDLDHVAMPIGAPELFGCASASPAAWELWHAGSLGGAIPHRHRARRSHRRRHDFSIS